jgi:SAM-dependent methyltransferase
MTKPYEIYTSGEYLCNNPDWDRADSEWKACNVIKLINKNLIQPFFIIDVGCGTGGVLVSLKNSIPNASYKGFDISPDAKIFWDQQTSPGIEFKVADFLSEANSQCDILLLLDIIEHLVDPFDFLTKIKYRSKFFIFHIPLDLSAQTVLREKPLLKVRKKNGHIHYFTKNLVLSLLEECDYEVIDWFYTGGAFNIKKTKLSGLLAKALRSLFNFINKDISARLLGGETVMILAKSRK